MKHKKFDAVEMKSQLQREAELKLAPLSEKEQLELLHRKFGHLTTQKVKTRFAYHGVLRFRRYRSR